ncbi:MAG: hypothetical protein RLO10_03505, partial [Roseovarius indicus]
MTRFTLFLALTFGLATAAPADTIETEVQRVDEIVAMYLDAAMKFAHEIDTITGETHTPPTRRPKPPPSTWTPRPRRRSERAASPA